MKEKKGKTGKDEVERFMRFNGNGHQPEKQLQNFWWVTVVMLVTETDGAEDEKDNTEMKRLLGNKYHSKVINGKRKEINSVYFGSNRS